MLSVLWILSAVAIIFILRKKMRFLSLIVIAEVTVLSAMSVAFSLSSLGIGGTYLALFSEAITSSMLLFGMKISTFMLFQAIVILMAVFVAMYTLLTIAKKIIKKRKKKEINVNVPEITIKIPEECEKRNVLKFCCRMNC